MGASYSLKGLRELPLARFAALDSFSFSAMAAPNPSMRSAISANPRLRAISDAVNPEYAQFDVIATLWLRSLAGNSRSTHARCPLRAASISAVNPEELCLRGSQNGKRRATTSSRPSLAASPRAPSPFRFSAFAFDSGIRGCCERCATILHDYKSPRPVRREMGPRPSIHPQAPRTPRRR